MDETRYYEIRVEGYLADHWSDWFEGLMMEHTSDRETTLSGILVDQAALLGVLNNLHALNLILISVKRVPDRGCENGR